MSFEFLKLLNNMICKGDTQLLPMQGETHAIVGVYPHPNRPFSDSPKRVERITFKPLEDGDKPHPYIGFALPLHWFRITVTLVLRHRFHWFCVIVLKYSFLFVSIVFFGNRAFNMKFPLFRRISACRVRPLWPSATYLSNIYFLRTATRAAPCKQKRV